MKALTICQPYAALIVRGEKLVENREWPTRYRGPLLIHAGKSREWLDDEDESDFVAWGDPLAFGAVVGDARLADVLHIDRIQRGEYDAKYPWLREHTHANGTWCWVLQDIRRYAQPVPWKGAQGLWEFPELSLPPNAEITGRASGPR
jgi:hypothetical protein